MEKYFSKMPIHLTEIDYAEVLEVADCESSKNYKTKWRIQHGGKLDYLMQ